MPILVFLPMLLIKSMKKSFTSSCSSSHIKNPHIISIIIIVIVIFTNNKILLILFITRLLSSDTSLSPLQLPQFNLARLKTKKVLFKWKKSAKQLAKWKATNESNLYKYYDREKREKFLNINITDKCLWRLFLTLFITFYIFLLICYFLASLSFESQFLFVIKMITFTLSDFHLCFSSLTLFPLLC